MKIPCAAYTKPFAVSIFFSLTWTTTEVLDTNLQITTFGEDWGDVMCKAT
jgi:hypothetical protein